MFNIKQKGESDNYSWGLRKINSNINIQAKIDRLKQRINTGKQIRNLEDNQFNFPDINQTIKSNTTNSNKVELFNQQTLYQKQTQSQEGLIASEKTIRDLAARMSDRIGIPVRFESDRSKEYKGKLENGTAIVNLAYATLDTPIHEILGHPIIRAIKNKQQEDGKNITKEEFEKETKNNTPSYSSDTISEFIIDNYIYRKVGNEYTKGRDIEKPSELYQNLLKELETGRGKEVLDRVKRDYKYKVTAELIIDRFGRYGIKQGNSEEFVFDTKEEAEGQIKKINSKEYTLEEQQEEAIVSLISEMIAGKIKETQNTKNLLTLLKKLLQQINDFIRSLINQKEIYIDKIPESNKEQLIESKLKQMIKDEIIRKECV